MLHHVARLRRPFSLLTVAVLTLTALAISRPQPAAAQCGLFCTRPNPNVYAPADLQVTELTAWSAGAGFYGLQVTVKNAGATTAWNFWVEFGVYDTAGGRVFAEAYRVDELRPGATIVFMRQWVPTGPGSANELRARVDGPNTVAESNEGNNYRSSWYYR
jgi:hypothetical protein